MTTTPDQTRRPVRAPIDTLESLRTHLQWAIELEHSTIPPYLCATYSLDAERNPAAVEVLASVFMEEMLHLTLAANLLNAVGGRPVLDAPQLMESFPRTVPHGDGSFALELLPFGPQAIERFLELEKPAPRGAPAEGDHYATIGQFYEAIEAGIQDLCERLGEATVFSGDPARQVDAAQPYPGSGAIVAVTDLASALDALREIVEQGEGAGHQEVWDGDHDMFHPDRDEVGHYFRIEELRLGRRYRRGDTPLSGPSGPPIEVDWTGVRPMQANPTAAETDTPVRDAQDDFNLLYSDLLGALDRTFNGRPNTLGASVKQMHGLKAQAQALMEMPIGDGSLTAGPTFAYIAPADRG
ncbi:ferritin-like protein [Nocardioides sp. NBC_00368]|uniref:ferritin-like domain-containing protein n=1 Tax=Nocardioides sp. NBC_00368 TaxID=2976000 RepID=UPI002E24FC3F